MDVIAREAAAHPQEAAANDDIGGAWLDRQGQNLVAMVARGIINRVHRIHIVIVVHQAGKLVVTVVHEAGVHAAIAEQACHAPAAGLVEFGKVAAHQDFFVILQLDAEHRVGLAVEEIIGAGAGIERRIHRPVRAQADEAVVARQIEIGERAADQQPAIRLEGQGVNHVGMARVRIVSANARGEPRVQRTIILQPRHAAGRRAVHGIKRAPDKKNLFAKGRYERVINPEGSGNPVALVHDNRDYIGRHPIGRAKWQGKRTAAIGQAGVINPDAIGSTVIDPHIVRDSQEIV